MEPMFPIAHAKSEECVVCPGVSGKVFFVQGGEIRNLGLKKCYYMRARPANGTRARAISKIKFARMPLPLLDARAQRRARAGAHLA